MNSLPQPRRPTTKLINYLFKLQVIIFLVVLIALLPALGLMGYTLTQQGRRAEQDALVGLNHLLEHTVAKYQNLIADTELFLSLLSQLPQLKPDQSEACYRLLSRLLETKPVYANLGVANLDGQIYCHGLNSTSINIADRQYFLDILANPQGISVGDYQLGRLTGKPAINFGYPVFAATDATQLVAVAYVALDLEKLQLMEVNSQLPSETSIYLIDDRATILAQYPTEKSIIGQTHPSFESILPSLTANPSTPATITDNAGIPWLYLSAEINQFQKNRPAYVLVGIPSSRIYGPISVVLNQSLKIMFLVIIFIILTIWAGSRFLLLRPLQRLLRVAKRLGWGNFKIRSGLAYHGEVGELAQSFDEMASNLEKFSAERERVQYHLYQRTQDLEEKNLTLEKTKRAMLNVLEDTKTAEEALKIEKENVEIKVKQRTHQLQKKTLDLEDAQKRVTEGWLEQQQEKARLNASMQALPLGFLLIDTNHKVILLNPAMQSILDLSPDADFATISALFGQTGFDFHTVCPHCRQDRQPFQLKEIVLGQKYLRLFSVPVLTNQDLIGAAIVVEDITDRKRLELAKDEFFSIASHELRTPLTAIRGNTAMIQDYYREEVKNPEVQEMIGDINTASTRLINLVNDFLDASRIDLNRLEFHTETFDLKDEALAVIDQFQGLAGPKNINLILETDGQASYPVSADRSRVRQILDNLAGNSLKFTKVGEIKIRLEKSETGIKLKVIDTGRGISPEHQAELFQRFSQVGQHGYTRETTQGSGMGLYISKKLAQGMGGQLYLDWSEPEKGSVFIVELPQG